MPYRVRLLIRFRSVYDQFNTQVVLLTAMRLARSRALPLSHRARARRAAAQLRLYLRLGLSDREPLLRAAKGHRAAATGSTNKGHRAAATGSTNKGHRAAAVLRARTQLHPLPAQARVLMLRGQLHLLQHRGRHDGNHVLAPSQHLRRHRTNRRVCQHHHRPQELQELQQQELQQVLLARAGALRARARKGVRARIARLTRREERQRDESRRKDEE